MKLGDALHIIWQHSHSTAIHGMPLSYKFNDKVISLNDIRTIWEFLNQEIPIEGTIIDACSGERSRYISEEGVKK